MWLKKNYKSIIRISYIIPILFAAGVSIAHVITWYSTTNPISWAVYLSVGIEIAALSALAGITAKMNKWIYVPFLIVTLLQFIGNVFFSFQYIDVTSELFKSWVSLVDPFFKYIGLIVDGSIIRHRIILATFSGGLIPAISLSFLHLLVSFNDKNDPNEKEPIKPKKIDIPEGKVSLNNYDLPDNIFESKLSKDVSIPEPEESPDLIDDDLEVVKNDIYNESESNIEKLVEKWEDSGILEGLKGTQNENILFSSPQSQFIKEPQQEELIQEEQKEELVEEEPQQPQNTGITVDDIREVKARKSNNTIERVGVNKYINVDDKGTLRYRR